MLSYNWFACKDVARRKILLNSGIDEEIEHKLLIFPGVK
jgi:hypothetical protein